GAMCVWTLYPSTVLCQKMVGCLLCLTAPSLDLHFNLSAELACGDLGFGLALVHDDLRLALVRGVRARIPGTPSELGLRLDPLLLLGLDLLLRGATRLFDRRLFLLHVLSIGAVVSAEHGQRTSAQFSGVLHEIEEGDIVAHDDQRPAPPRDHIVEVAPGLSVEVVGRLV